MLSSTSGSVSNQNVWLLPLALILAIAVAFASIVDQVYGLAIVGFMLFCFVVVAVWKKPILAVLINIVIAHIGFFITSRVLKVDVPLGIVVDSLHLFAFISMLMNGQIKGFKTPIGIFIIIWFSFLFLQIFNPNNPNLGFWIQGFRLDVGLFLPFFIIYTYLSNNENVLKTLLRVWFGIGVLCALYTIYQELMGYPEFELSMIVANEETYNLLYTFGRLRKMGTFAGPTEGGIVMAINAILSLSFVFGKDVRKRTRLMSIVVFILSVVAMIYTGTRTAIIIWIIGTVIYSALTYNRILIAGCVLGFFLVGPYVYVSGKGGAALRVMLTAFHKNDPSMQVRYDSQKQIRDLILPAPMGYGIGRDTNDVTDIQPDSTFVRLAILSGWVGMILWLIFQYVILHSGIDSLRPRNKDDLFDMRNGIFTVAIIIFIAQYPQSLFAYPTMKIMYMICLAVLSLRMDDGKLSEKIS